MGLVETGTHVVCGAALGPYATGEVTLAAAVVPTLTPEMLCLADRGFVGFDAWHQARATGAALLWPQWTPQIRPSMYTANPATTPAS